MSEHSTKPSTVDDEIDLGVFFEGIKSFFKSILRSILNIFRFYYKHKYILIALIVTGGVLGYFYEQISEKTYQNDLLVTPNFGSSDYLYTKIETLDKKLTQKDTVFLKETFGVNYNLFKSVEINPVVDIYSFVSRNATNQKLFELLFEEEGNIEFIENPINSRNFKYHHLLLSIKGEDYHEELSDGLMSFVNNNQYFNDLKNLSLENLDLQLKENKVIVNQIDSIIEYSKNRNSLTLGSNMLSFSDNKGLDDLLTKKNGLIIRQEDLQKAMVNQDLIVKVVDANYKILDKESLFKKNKAIVFPLLLVLLYSVFFLLRYFSKKAKSLTL
jgi:hypothetical protein